MLKTDSTLVTSLGSTPVEGAKSLLRSELLSRGRVLIVDDNLRAGELVQRELAKSYFQVDRTSSPGHAVRSVKFAAYHGKPYDAVVTDLLMPKMDGLSMIAKLGKKAPAVVLLTASTMAPHLLHMESELSRGGNLARILVQHKTTNSIVDLPAKIDAAIALHAESPGLISEFFRSYKPRHLEREPGVEDVHNFCEEVRNLGAELGAIIRNLKAEHALEDTSWWKKEGARLDRTIDMLTSTGISRVWKATPGATDKNLHDLQNVIALQVSPPSIAEVPELKRNSRGKELISMWTESVNRYAEICTSLRNGFNSLYEPSFKLEEFIPRICPAGLRVPDLDPVSGHPSHVSIKDPEHRVRNFLVELYRAFDDCTKNVRAHMRGGYGLHVPESCREGEDASIRARLSSIGCGSYWMLSLSADNVILEQSLVSLVPALSILKQHKEAVFEVLQVGERSFFELYIKTSEQSLDLEAIEAQKVREMLSKKPDGSYVIPKNKSELALWVCEDLGDKGNLIALNDTPLGATGEGDRDPLIYFWNDKIIYSNYLGHAISARMIVKYVRHKLKESGQDLGAWSSANSIEQVYLDALRVKITSDGKFLLDGTPNSESVTKASEALIQLGISKDKIEADGYNFAPKLEPHWWAQERHIDSI